jgi:hypothetical protein
VEEIHERRREEEQYHPDQDGEDAKRDERQDGESLTDLAPRHRRADHEHVGRGAEAQALAYPRQEPGPHRLWVHGGVDGGTLRLSRLVPAVVEGALPSQGSAVTPFFKL